MSTSVLLGSAQGYLPVSASAYYGAVAGRTFLNTTIGVEPGLMVSTGGTISNLRVVVSVDPGSGNSWIFTLYKGSSPTDITCTVGVGTTTSSDLTHSVAVVAGDMLSMQVTSSGSPSATTYAGWGVQFESTNAKESLLCHSDYSSYPDASPVDYRGFGGGGASGDAAQLASVSYFTVPCTGSIKNLWVNRTVGPSVGKTKTYTLYKNGGTTSLATSIVGAATANHDTDAGHAVSVSVGDLICIQSGGDTSGVDAGSTSIGVTFVAETDGNFIIPSIANRPWTGGTDYVPAYGGYANSALETYLKQVAPCDFTAKAIYLQSDVAPGSTNEWSYTFRNGSDSGLTVTISNAETSNNSSSDVSVTAGQFISYKTFPTNSPAWPFISVGMLAYIAPSGGNPVYLQGVI